MNDFNLTTHNCNSSKILPHYTSWNSLRNSHVFSSLILHLATVHNFSGRLLHLLQLRNEVPEAGLGDDMVRSEDPHAVQRRSRAFRRGQAPPDHLVLPQLEGHKKQATRRTSDTESANTAEPAPRRTRAPQRNNATRGAQSRSRERPWRRAGRSRRRSPRGAARRSGPTPGGSGAAAMLATRGLTGQAAPFKHARATLEHYNPPPPSPRQPPRPHSRPQPRPSGPGPYSRCPTPSWRSSAAARRKRKGRPRAPQPDVSHPAPPRRPARRLAAIRARGCQSPRAALASGLAAPRGPARPAPVLPCRQPRPRPPVVITGPVDLRGPDRRRAGCA